MKNQVAKARAKKHRRRSAVNPWTDVTDGKTDTEPQPAAPEERQPSRDSSNYSVLSEPECPQRRGSTMRSIRRSLKEYKRRSLKEYR